MSHHINTLPSLSIPTSFAPSIATVSLPGPLSSKLHAIAAAGFKFVEFFEDDILPYVTEDRLEDVRSLCEQLKLKCVMLQPFRELEGWSEGANEEKEALKRLEIRFDWMDVLGIDMILVVSSCTAESNPDLDACVRQLRNAAEMAQRRGKQIAYEALAWGTHVDTWEKSWEVVRMVDMPNFGLCLDSFHVLATLTKQKALSSFLNPQPLETASFGPGSADSRSSSSSSLSDLTHSPASAFSGLTLIPADKLFIVQIADAPVMPLPFLQWSRHHRCYPLQGELPVVEFLEAVIGDGWKGLVSLEIFSDKHRSTRMDREALDGLTREGMESLIAVEKMLMGGEE